VTVEVFFLAERAGTIVGLRLGDGTRVALKIHRRRTEEYLHAMQQVQGQLWSHGFPCPRPLGVRGTATLEEWIDDGEYLDAHDSEVRRVLADQLARLVDIASGLRPSAALTPFFPPAGGPLWPKPHSDRIDFESTAEDAAWIDDIAREARRRRDAHALPLVVGHHDWTIQHVRFAGLEPTVVYDWDSLSAGPEPVFAGDAAEHFTYTEHLDVERWPTVAEAAAFLDDYERARGRAFTDAERETAKAAAVYARAYSTRFAHALGHDPGPMQLDAYARELLG